MAIVALDFTPPQDPNIVSLHILEAATKDGPWSEIEVVTSIGTAPNYITRYTTDQANSLTDWFAIQWEDDKGALSAVSEGIQGGTETVVSILTDRVMLRDPTLNEIVVSQEAEGVVASVLKTTDPLSIDPANVSADQVTGMTFLVMGRAYISKVVTESSSASGTGYTAGLVSQTASSTAQTRQQANVLDTIDWLLKQANIFLGTNLSLVLELEDGDPTGAFVVSGVDGLVSSLEWDVSRWPNMVVLQ
jgi:hypothetical protein